MTMSRSRVRIGALLTSAVLLLAACGGDDDGGGGGGGGNGSAAAKCPIGALAKASKPVQITMWHAMTRANEETLKALTDKFNGSQSDVRVSLVNQTSYTDTLTKFKAGLTSGDLPDLAQIQDISLQLMIDSQAALPAQACVDAEKYDLSDHVERVIQYYTVKDTLWPMPFNVSNPVLYYNKAAFRKAGLDPEKPPGSFDELREASQKIVDSGATKAGLAIKLDAWFLEHWTAGAGQTFVNNGNGREARATEVTFGEQPGPEIFEFLSSMVKDKLAVDTPNQGVDHYLAVANENAAMTIESSAGLGTIAQLLGSGQYANVELGVGPMPGPDGPSGVLVGGAALYLINKSPAAKQEAAWRFAKFLNEPESQAEWGAGTGYVPIRKSAVDLPPIQTRWAEIPGFKVAYDQLTTGSQSDATAGPVIGDYAGVREAVIAALESMYKSGLAPDKALKQAVDKSNAAIEEYNSRIGG